MKECGGVWEHNGNSAASRSAGKLAPVLDDELVANGAHMLKVSDVAGDDGQPVSKGNGCDHHVGHADGPTAALEIGVSATLLAQVRSSP
jgi:hypothetical protein